MEFNYDRNKLHKIPKTSISLEKFIIRHQTYVLLIFYDFDISDNV
jgi:hypothetical protein